MARCDVRMYPVRSVASSQSASASDGCAPVRAIASASDSPLCAPPISRSRSGPRSGRACTCTRPSSCLRPLAPRRVGEPGALVVGASVGQLVPRRHAAPHDRALEVHVHVRRPHAVVHPQRHARVPVRREERIELLAGVGHALLELVAGDEQRHAGGARHLDHALDVGEELGLADARDVLQRGAAAGEHTHQRRELGVVGLAARHRSVVAVGVHHRGRQPERARGERVVEHRAQLLALGRGGRPLPCRVAHHPGAQELVGEEPDGVDRGAVLGRRRRGTPRRSPTSTGPRAGTPRRGCPR